MGDLRDAAATGVFHAAEAFLRDGETALARPAAHPGGWSPLPPHIERELALAGPAGRQALETIHGYAMRIAFRQHGGCMFVPHNTIYVDTTNGSATTILVHEATHGRWWNEGRSAKPAGLSRADFIARFLDEETDAAVNEINAYLQLRKNGVTVPEPPLYPQYAQGFSARVMREEEAALRAGSYLPWAERQRVGDEGGRAAVNAAYHQGHVRSSTTGKPYTETYGLAWDKHHGVK